MPVNLSVKRVPNELADKLRARAERNRRSLQKELLNILELAVDERLPAPAQLVKPPARTMSIEEVVERARKRFPNGTEGSVAFIRELRQSR